MSRRSHLGGGRVGDLVRTCGCGEVGPDQVGETVTLFGWVHRRRDHGGLLFLDLRDRTGIVQTVYHPESAPEAFRAADQARPEYVVAVRGRVALRPEGRVNPNLATGTVEVLPELVRVLSPAKPPPFELDDREDVADEATRLRYRYVDLRRPAARDPLVLRHRIAKAIRDFADAHGFVEVETPYLTRSTPEGARDYLVPSRLSPGRFYALPQSPQLFKQLLMVAGFERYLQIVRCFRDEDLRADRQPEFTQVDLECSFVDRDDVLALVEAMVAHVYREVFGIELRRPFVRLTHAEALSRYGTDKPDLRYGLELVDWTDLVRTSGFGVFRQAAEAGGLVKAIRVPRSAARDGTPPAEWSRRELDGLAEVVAPHGARGVLWMAVGPPGPDGSGAPGDALPEVRSPAARHLSADELAALLERAGAGPGDLLLAVAGPAAVTLPALGALRVRLARRLGLVPEPNTPEALDRARDALCWVVDFPMFTWDAEAGRWAAEHHPFTAPRDEDLELLESDPGRVRAKAYDLVLNGYEAASGSIRIHRRDLQEKVFTILGLAPEEARERFGFLLDAFEHGTPPHGGIALGFDRVCMCLAGRASLRDVIAFPKTASAADPLTGAPAEVDPAQLEALHLQVAPPRKSRR